VIGTAILVSLGIWQLQRLGWKNAILVEIDQSIVAAPVAVPEFPDPETDRYLPVTATGELTNEEVHVLVSTRGAGAGFRIISLFRTEDGRRLLLDRGIVDDYAKEDERPPVTATITGNIHWPDETDYFTPDPDRVANVWFARDANTLSRELGAEPFLIILRTTTEDDSPVVPLPLDSRTIPNDHLGYAITWFGLAAVWAGMTVYWILRIRRS